MPPPGPTLRYPDWCDPAILHHDHSVGELCAVPSHYLRGTDRGIVLR